MCVCVCVCVYVCVCVGVCVLHYYGCHEKFRVDMHVLCVAFNTIFSDKY